MSGRPRHSSRAREAGVTLLEVLIAVTLLSLLTVAMMFAMRIGLMAYSKTTARLMDNRRVAGAQRILEEELQGIMPVVAPCSGKPDGQAAPAANAGPGFAFFQAQPQSMRMVSGFSLQGGWRGMPKILEFLVIPGEEGRGVRLVVNEVPYTGPVGAGRLCSGMIPDPTTGISLPRFPPVMAGPASFVLADKLAYCRFTYQWVTPNPQDLLPIWSPVALSGNWPMAIRVEMAPLELDPASLQLMTVTAPVHLHLGPAIPYVDAIN